LWLTALGTPFSSEGRELLSLIKRKAPDSEVDPVFDRIHTLALTLTLPPILCSTDAYVTCICFIGSKSLSHVLSCIDRCKDRLLSISNASSAAQKQVIESVMQYWKDQPGVGVNIVDKLLNYTILTPTSVVDWALGDSASKISEAYIFEMVSSTIQKVTKRVRQVVASRDTPGLPADQKAMLYATLDRERQAMRELFASMEDRLVAWASGSKDQMLERDEDTGLAEEGGLVKQWGQRWLRAIRRRAAVEEAWFIEVEAAAKARMDDSNGLGNEESMDMEV
jgi:nuclear cap-binding protein subunit 1